jgi:thiamine-monophosphate kinase
MSQKNKDISSIGEFGIIDMVKSAFSNKVYKNIKADIGDDAFCFKSGKEIISITKDLLIENVHFKKDWISPFCLAQKSVEINISDLAAMGCVYPMCIFIGLGIPQKTSVDFVKDFLKGIKTVCDKYGIYAAGGDTVRSDKIVISITAVGKSKNKDAIIKRSGAKEGDLIGVTNTFGDAGAGLNLLYKYGLNYKYNEDEKYLISKQNNPKARLKEAQKISKYLHSLTDASDGLFFSIELIAKASKKGALIDINSIPVSNQLKNAVADKKKRIDYALFGAEDFELVFTLPPSKAKIVQKIIPQISFIGKITNSKRILFKNGNKKEEIKFKGFKHF